MPLLPTSDNSPDLQWYVAVVKHNTEKSSRQRLTDMGFETFVASQMVHRTWRNGRKARVEKVVIPMAVFIKCTEMQRRQLVSLSYITRFMTNRAAKTDLSASAPAAIIPQHEIDTLRRLLSQSEIPVEVVGTMFHVDDNVVITRGELSGISGRVLATREGKSEVVIAIGLLGAAKMTIGAEYLRLETQSDSR